MGGKGLAAAARRAIPMLTLLLGGVLVIGGRPREPLPQASPLSARVVADERPAPLAHADVDTLDLQLD